MWLKKQAKLLEQKILNNIQNVLFHGRYIMGPEVYQLEQKLAEYVGVKYALGCSSGTDALLLSLMAHDIKPGDYVFTTSFSFIATSEVISLLGAIPVFIDIEPNTYNIDPHKLLKEIKKYPQYKRKGIISVNLFGLPANYKLINAIAKEYDLFVIEDACQSFGAEYNEKKSCSLADIGCTSFFPSKPLGCYGDGGMCFTDNKELYDKMVSLRVHGKGDSKYHNINVGLNARLDTIQAAILLAKFSIFELELERREMVVKTYEHYLHNVEDITIPYKFNKCKSAWAQYSILTKDKNHRFKIQKKLKENFVQTVIYYETPLHLQPVYQELGYKEGDLKISEDYSNRILSLPMNPYITPDEPQNLSNLIKECSS